VQPTEWDLAKEDATGATVLLLKSLDDTGRENRAEGRQIEGDEEGVPEGTKRRAAARERNIMNRIG